MRRAITATVLLAACSTSSDGRGGAGAPGPAEAAWASQVRIPDHMERPPPALEEEIARCIAGLDAAEFEASSHAAGRLVEIGVPAVPYLGFAASKAADGKRLRIVLDAILMEAAPERIALLFASPYPDVRVAAAGACGDRRLTELGPPLVDLLEDPDVDVRRAGIASLRRLANQFYGYRADDPPAQRAAAVARWREHWKAG
jgi:HEAT repeat protein